MRRQFMYGVLIAAAMAVGVAAQSTSSQTSSDKSVTFTGCLASGSGMAGATGTTGTTGTTTSEEFVLQKAEQKSDMSSTYPSSTNPSSTTPTATGTTGTSGETLRLVASSGKADWSKYLNHKVEVKGTLDRSESPSASSTANPSNPTNPSSASSGTSGYQSMSQPTGTLHVSSIREIASSCSGQ